MALSCGAPVPDYAGEPGLWGGDAMRPYCSSLSPAAGLLGLSGLLPDPLKVYPGCLQKEHLPQDTTAIPAWAMGAGAEDGEVKTSLVYRVRPS